MCAGDFILEPYDISSLFPTAGDEGFPAPDSGAVERKQPLIAGIALLVAVVAGLLWRRMEFRHAAFVTRVLIIAAEQFVEWGFVGERTRQQRLAVVEQLSSLRARLEIRVNGKPMNPADFAARIEAEAPAA